MDNTLVDKLTSTVEREARAAEHRWPGVLDADDIGQEIWLHILESPSAQEFLTTAEAPVVAKSIRRIANSVCSQERIDYDQFRGNWYYNTPEVETILRAWNSGKELPGDTTADLQLGLKALRKEHPTAHRHIVNIFINGTYRREKGGKDRKSRALKKLTASMNRVRVTRPYIETPIIVNYQ